MKVARLAIPDVMLIEPRVFGDTRGFFYESFNAKVFQAETGLDVNFVQDNHSRSSKGVLRGLHYQLPPHAQGKLVRVVRGAVFDVAVDLRKSSKTFGRWVGLELTSENHRQLWIPAGFAHGFLVMSELADFVYKTTEFYNSSFERCLRWDDPSVGIRWPESNFIPIVSEKDQAGSALHQLDLFEQPAA